MLIAAPTEGVPRGTPSVSCIWDGSRTLPGYESCHVLLDGGYMHQSLSRWIVSSVFPIIVVGVPSCSADGAGGPSSVSRQEPTLITIEGELRCLPHRPGQPTTFECAIGLRQSDERYYGLRNLKEGVGLNDRVRITGRFTPGPAEPYDVVGTIDVESQVRLEKN
jgi:hypothetical protein